MFLVSFSHMQKITFETQTINLTMNKDETLTSYYYYYYFIFRFRWYFQEGLNSKKELTESESHKR